jgi:hypothetical protein
VNDGSAVDREVRDGTPFHQVDENQGKTRLDHVSAEHPDARALGLDGIPNPAGDLSQRIGDENVRKGLVELAERSSRSRRRRGGEIA